jgi:uncharacterized protein (DUF983 family)
MPADAFGPSPRPKSGLPISDFGMSKSATADLDGPLCGHLRVTEKIRAMAERIIDTLSGSIRAGLSCACPRCGRGKLFQGFLTLRPRCEACGLDYGFADAGDGPAVFIMFFAGFIVVGAALIVEALYHPPYWVHAVLWLPLIVIVTIGPLRPMKGLMIALQYHHKAEEGRFGGDSGGEP